MEAIMHRANAVLLSAAIIVATGAAHAQSFSTSGSIDTRGRSIDGSFAAGGRARHRDASGTGVATGSFEYSKKRDRLDATGGLGGSAARGGVSASGVGLGAVSETRKGGSAAGGAAGSVGDGNMAESKSGIITGGTALPPLPSR
jgi:hypothetical protein